MSSAPAQAPDDHDMELFELVASAAPEEREEALRAACPDSPETRKRVLDMLAWENRMSGFLERPFFDVASADDSFTPGAVVAERFEIRREIAEGGMGRVFEAFDRRRGETVALKVPALPYRRRLVGELRNAARVTHPNICRVHEVHTGQTSGGQPVEFLTMEYLDGPTLAARLRSGPLSIAEVHSVAQQVCAGLAEAHAHNIVHGDLKPNNIILASNDGGGMRAVVTDFGLAQAIAPNGVGSPFAASLRGAAEYIAPERWKGAGASKASDVYAFGVLLFEMLTGTRPQRSTRIDVSQVPRRWRKVVRCCLLPEPERRLRDAAAVLACLPKDHSRLVLLALLLLVFTGVAVAAWEWMNIPVVPDAVRLAVLTADTDAPSSVVASGMALDLSERLATTESSHRPLVIIPVEKSIRYHVATAESARRVLGATHALSMRWRSRGAEFDVDLSIIDAQTGRALAAARQSVERAKLEEVVRRVAAAAGGALRRGVSPGPSPPSYADYAESLYYLRQARDAGRALAGFERLAARNPADVWIAARLAQASLADYTRTRSEHSLARATALIDGLSSRAAANPDAALLLADLEDAAGRSERALDIYSRLAEGTLRRGPALRGAAGVLQRLGHTDEAERMWLKAIDAEPGYFQPRMDLGVLRFMRGNYAGARDQFALVTNMAPGLAIPHYDLAAVLVDLGDYARAEQEYHQALAIEEDPDTLTGIGALLAYQNRDAESVSYYERAVASGPEDPLRLSNLADSYRRTGRTAQAAETYWRVIGVADRRLNANPSDAFNRSLRAWALANLGQRGEALREIRTALKAGDQVKVRKRAVLVLAALGLDDQAFRLLDGAPPTLLAEISRYPDLSSFVRSGRFKKLNDH